MNRKELTYRDLPVEIIRRPYQRSISVRVLGPKSLRVVCGKGIPDIFIRKFLSDSDGFIEKGLEQWRNLRAQFPLFEFISGDELLWRGERVPLHVIWTWADKPKAKWQDGGIELKAPLQSTQESRRLGIAKLYQREAKATFHERVEGWSERMQLKPTRLSVRGQRSRWGSCSSKGSINLNWKLVAAPSHILDYVIVHELAHLKEANHSPRFWKIVANHIPEYQSHRRWLRTHQHAFDFLEKKSI